MLQVNNWLVCAFMFFIRHVHVNQDSTCHSFPNYLFKLWDTVAVERNHYHQNEQV